MNVISNRTPAYWKECAVTLRERLKEHCATKQHYVELRKALQHAYRRIEQIGRKVLVCVVLLILAGGCNMVNGAFKDGAWLLDKAAENTEVQEK